MYKLHVSIKLLTQEDLVADLNFTFYLSFLQIYHHQQKHS